MRGDNRGFEWDAEKSERTRRLRGFGFRVAKLVFRDPLVHEFVARGNRYGEQRFIAIGTVPIFGILFVVWTPRGPNRRIISARHANKSERSRYEKANEID